MSIFRREKTNFFGKARKTKTLAEPHQKTNRLLLGYYRARAIIPGKIAKQLYR
jgi:hypothetical protein